MRTYKLYNLLCCVMVTILLACDVMAFKTISVFGMHFAASGLLFPFSFLIICILAEVYGYSLAGRVIWIQLTCSILFLALINILVIPDHRITSAFNIQYFQIYHFFWRVIIASVIAVPLAYFVTDWIMSRFKLKNFWMSWFRRYIFANIAGKFIIVAIAYPINFSHIYSAPIIIKLILDTWIFKMGAAIVLSPIAWFLIPMIKKIEKLDTFDYGISYNPIRVFHDHEQGENRYHE